ncbi:MAG: glycosyl transferase [Deltaproteobacteria bacterium]|nr:MAG: glycosyl transferase [Deltaproteobacteria bacterium]
MKVVYVGSPQLFSGGASAIHVMKMCNAMSNLGIKVELVLPSYDKGKDIFEYYGVRPVFKITTLPSFSNSSLRHISHGILSAFYTRLKKESFDLVLTRNIVYTYISACFFGIPTIYDAHHPLVNGIAHHLFNSFKKSKHLLRFSTNSKGLGEIYLRLGLPQEKLVVAPNGVDLERFQIGVSKEEARKLVGLDVKRKIVCYSGNVYEGRGIELLIDVARELKDIVFVVVGGLESDVNRYRRLAEEKQVGNFVFTGFVPHKDVVLYLLSADVLVMPYTSYMTIRGGTVASKFTSPIKLFEYMASCRPIVATSIPAVKEILEDNKNAVLVEPDSVSSLVNGIKRVVSEKEFADKLAFQAFIDVKRYTWEERVKRILGNLVL